MTDGTRQQFIYTLQPVDSEKAKSRDGWTDEDLAMFDRHWAHLENAARSGTLVLAGRAQDGIGPAIVDCASEDEARSFMESDPFISSGFARGSLHPFRVALSRNKL